MVQFAFEVPTYGWGLRTFFLMKTNLLFAIISITKLINSQYIN